MTKFKLNLMPQIDESMDRLLSLSIYALQVQCIFAVLQCDDVRRKDDVPMGDWNLQDWKMTE